MKNPFSVVKDFEDAVAEYCGAPYCVAVNSCTNALFLALAYYKYCDDESGVGPNNRTLTIPKRTYISVPAQIKHAGYSVEFEDLNWKGSYQLKPIYVYDAARRFTSNMFNFPEYENGFVCVSFHWSKILGIQQGGAILFDDYNGERMKWFKKARFDGRTEGVAPKDDNIDMLGWHMYMSPEIAAEGLVRLHHLPRYNADLPNDDYPDLSQMSIFK